MTDAAVKNLCRICGNAGDEREYGVREMMYGTRLEYKYFRCGACGCLQISSIPADTAALYPQNYYSFQSSPERDGGSIKRMLRRQRSRYALGGRGWMGKWLARFTAPSLLLETWLKPAGAQVESRILEVGCGDGKWLRELRELGFLHLTGADPFLPQDFSRPGIRLLRQELADLEGPFDFIMLHHCFEHLADPQAALGNMRRLLASGGSVLLRIPLSSSLAWERYGTDWIQLDAPRHFFLHTPRSLEILAKAAGFRIVRTHFDSTEFQFWGSEQYRMDIPLQDPRSHAVDPSHSPFPPERMEDFRRQALELNAASRGDQAGFFLVPL